MWMGTRLLFLQRSGKGGLGWQTPKPTPKGFTPTRSTETTSKMTQNLNYQKPQSTKKSTQDVHLGKYPSQAKKQWEAEMERLNSKYGLDCFSNSELHSESDEGEQYQYEYGYETLI